MRVHEAAKKLGLSTQEIIEKLGEIGVKVGSHMSTLETSSFEKLKQKLFGKSIPEEKSEKPVPDKPRVTSEKGTVKSKTAGKKDITEAKETPSRPQLDVPEGTTVKEFAQILGKDSSEVIKTLISLGEMATINQPVSSEAINVLAEEFGYEANIIPLEEVEEEVVVEEGPLEPRSPVVTVMGHVDHGKTRLLDTVRKTDVMSQEAGGITQHIGAYQVLHNKKKITFIDTPGHEAFTAMRARGAQVTDIAVLVVAADDGVMPQTVEAIDHAKAAGVPIIVAVNKIDKPEANPEKVRKQLAKLGLNPEDWGGDTVYVDISAKENVNINELLDMIQLVAELQELKASKVSPAHGIVIDAKLDKGRGAVATVLVQRGTLRVGNAVVAGISYGKIRAMIDDKGQPVAEAEPARPVEVLGLSAVPQAGDELKTVQDEKVARRITEEKALRKRLVEQERRKHLTLDDLFKQIKEGEIKDLNLVIKADAQGSIEALRESLEKLDQKEVRINIIHRGTGAISETDVMLASASNAIVIGFNVRPTSNAKTMAEKEGVDLRTYRVIYKVVEDINAARIGMLPPKVEEVEKGRAEVRKLFKISKVGVVAGCFVEKGEITADSRARLVREGTVVYEGKIASLRRFKEEANSVKEGLECGIRLEDFQDIKEGDIIEAYVEIKKPASGD